MVKLNSIKQKELKKAYRMHRKGFLPTFLKYLDRINPIFESFKRFNDFYNHPDLYMYWITLDGIAVGEIWIAVSNDTAKLARLFVLKEYQNRGIAQQVIRIAENLFPVINDGGSIQLKKKRTTVTFMKKWAISQSAMKRKSISV